jgi:hypothetical protein
VTLLWRGCESPAEVFFPFFAFSLFTRTSLADEFLCIIYIELKVQECKHTRLTRRLLLDDCPLSAAPTKKGWFRRTENNDEKNVRPRGARPLAA